MAARKKYSQEEKQWLSERFGYMCLDNLLREHNQDGRFPLRNKADIRAIAYAMGETTIATLDDFSGQFLRATLKITDYTLLNWIKEGLKCTQALIGNRRYSFKLKDVKAFAKKRPDLLAGCDRAGLKWLLGEELESLIPVGRKRDRVVPVKVKNLNTNKVYPSLANAAKDLGCSVSKVKNRIIRNKPLNGSYWAIEECNYGQQDFKSGYFS